MTSRTPRIPSANSNTSLGAVRAANRLSRVSPSDFERVLLSNETVVFSEGRDEDLLGKSTRGFSGGELSRDVSGDLDDLSTPDPRSSLLSTSTSSSSDTRRRSVNCSPGTSPSPDLPTLNGQARRTNSKDAFGAAEDDATSAVRSEQEYEEGGREGSRTPEGRRLSATSDVDGDTTPVAASSRTPHSSTSPSAPVALSIPADLLSPSEPSRTSEVSIGSVSSYVHVGIPTEEEMASPFASPRRRGSGASGKPGVGMQLEDSPTKRNRLASNRDDESTKSSSFSNTMRKTSRFFRKFGSSSKNSSPSTSTFSAHNTPTSGSFSSHVSGSAPPVPAIPLAYASVSPTKRVDSRAIVSPPPRTASIDITISSPRRLPNPKEPLTSPDSPSRSTTTSGHSRRRSVSLSSGAAPLAQRDRRASLAKAADEEDRLKGELQRWKQDIDGMLDSVGDGGGLLLSPNGGKSKVVAKRAATAPPSPAVGMPKFSPLDLSFPGTSPSTSSEKTRPTWDTSWTNGSNLSSTIVPPRAASLPNSSLDYFSAASTSTSTLPPPFSTSPAPLSPAPAAESMEPPRIRLVSPDPSFSDDQDDEFESLPSSFANDPSSLPQSQTTREKRLSLVPGALPASLATITESSHSRESSLTTPTKPDSTSPATPDPSRAPPLLFTQSPSPGFNLQSQLQSRKNVRHSVVAYPAGRTFSAATGQSTSSSRTSLQSDGMGRRGSSKSLEEDGVPLEEKAKALAQRCWDEDASLVETKKLAEWLGSLDSIKAATLTAYIEMFDFAGLRLDLAFRRLCEKLYLKAESQQIDRILVEFSRWYWENNPTCLYRSADIVHAVSYSLLLLNTDLHVVDSTVRMSRRAFVANILHTINEQATPEVLAPALLFGPNTTDESEPNNVFGGGEASASHKSVDRIREGMSKRSGSIHSWKNGKDSASLSMPNFGSPSPTRSRGSSSVVSPSAHDAVRSPSLATINAGRAADAEIEPMLKEMYNAIKAQPIYQRTSSTLSLTDSRSSVSLTPGGSPYGTWSRGVNRSASRRSATPSTMSGSSGAFKRSSMRGFSFLGSSSVDLARSGSPTPSSTTSLNDDNSSTAYGATSHHQIPTIGFANSLSHTIIREQQEDDNESDSGVSVTDEELALLGAPWAKEGILWRKHFWESVGKRSKEKNWLQVFVVISQGEVRMFRFDGAGTTRGRGAAGLGGGDWASNAQSVGEISLTHALCAAMPPPGYNRDRPHCFALTLPSGSSYFFQAGTQDLVQEWVQTCNYWSARLSKEPLSGGVSNMEYGWNRVVDADDEVEEMASIRSGKSGKSGRSVRSKASYGGSTMGGRNDRIVVHDWKPPSTPLGASALTEEAQLESLRRHVAIINAELEQHKPLRMPMCRLFSPRSLNLANAMANWERKLQHLSAENVKYEQYIESLAAAIQLRSVQRGKRVENEMLLIADDNSIHARSLSPVPPSPVAEGSDEDADELGDDAPSVATSVDEFFDLPSPTSPTSEHAT